MFERWDPAAKLTFDRRVMDDLRLLRFVDEHHYALIIGPVGVGKTMIAHALGPLAIARDLSVHCETAEKLLHRLRACRLDGTHERERRRLTQVDVLIATFSPCVRCTRTRRRTCTPSSAVDTA